MSAAAGASLRVDAHPVLGDIGNVRELTIYLDDAPVTAREGETIAATLTAAGLNTFRYTKSGAPRRMYCGIGRCTDCVMVVDGSPNVRTCVTLVREGMDVRTQRGLGSWSGVAAGYGGAELGAGTDGEGAGDVRR